MLNAEGKRLLDWTQVFRKYFPNMNLHFTILLMYMSAFFLNFLSVLNWAME